MPPDTVTALVAALGDCRLLEPGQLSSLRELERHFTEPRSLARELMKRGWLTAYQVNRLLQGVGGELLLGSYVLMEKLGEGGMGTVFKARNWKLGRVVALKLVRKERLAGAEAVRRFRREIEAAAQLDHPNIVRALDADEVAGSHFLVMEYVEGADLGRFLKEQGPPPVEKACEYVRQVALGLQHAFERGLIHRDIKPSNLLLTADGQTVKILDFGLARLGDAGDDASTLTETGAVMGTPDYISPEQALNAKGVDIRSDLYSLGCAFYHLLTGRPPFPGGLITEKLLRHQMDEPPPIEPLRPGVDWSVVRVVGRLMAKRPEGRYQTPKALANDLAGVLGLAPPPDPFADLRDGDTEVLPRSGRRPRCLIALGASVAVVALLLGLVFWPRRQPQPVPGPPPGPAGPPLEQPEDIPAKERFDWQPKELVAVLGEHQGRDWGLLRGIALDAAGKTIATTRHDHTIELWDAATLRPWKTPALGSYVALFSPDGRTLATREPTHPETRLWDLSGGEAKDRGRLPQVLPLAFSSDGKRLATLSAVNNKVVHVWDLSAAPFARGPDLPGAVTGVGFGPGGKTLVVCDLAASEMRVWDLTVGTPTVRTIPLGKKHPNDSTITFSRDGQTLGIGNATRAEFWDLADSRASRPRLELNLRLGTFSADGKSMFYRDGADLWRYPLAANAVAAVWARGIPGWHLAYSGDGRTLATAEDCAIRLWDVSDKEVRDRFPPQGPTRPISAVAFLPDGKTLAALSSGQNAAGELALWDLAGRRVRMSLPIPQGRETLAVNPDGKSIVVAGPKGWHRYNSATGKHLCSVEVQLWAIAFSPDGMLLAGSGSDSHVYVWDVFGKPKLQLKLPQPVPPSDAYTGRGAAFSPGGRRLATSAGIYQISSGKQVQDIDGEGAELFRSWLRSRWATRFPSVTLSADGRLLAYITPPGGKTVLAEDAGASRLAQEREGPPRADLLLTEARGGHRLHEWKLPGPVHSVAFAPDGRHLALGNGNGTVYILRLTNAVEPGD